MDSNSWLAESRNLHAKLLKRDVLVEKLRAENGELQKKAALAETFRAENTNLTAKLAKLSESLPALRETAARAGSYKAELQALELKVKKMQTATETIRADCDHYKSIAEKVDSYRAECLALTSKISRMQTKLEAAEATIAQLKREHEVSDSDIDDGRSSSPLSHNSELPSARIRALSFLTVSDEVLKLQNLLASVTAQADARATQISELRQMEATQRNEIAQLRAQIAKAQSELEQLRHAGTPEPAVAAELQLHRRDSQILTRAHEALQQQYEILFVKHATLEEELVAIKKQQVQGAASEVELVQLQDTCAQLRAELELSVQVVPQATLAELESLKATIVSLQLDLDSKRADLQQKSAAVDSVQAQLSQLQEKHQLLLTEHGKCGESTNVISQLNQRIAQLEQSLQSYKQLRVSVPKLLQQGRGLRTLLNGLRSATADGIQSLYAGLTVMKSQSDSLASSLAERVLVAERRYLKESTRRKELQNQLVSAGGNIRVYCRVRPINSSEQSAQLKQVCTVSDEDIDVAMEAGHTKTFEYDHVFNQRSTQQDVYAHTEPLIMCALEGFNVCLFAYGQTGAGKTYTMEGPADDPGLVQRSLRTVFGEIDARRGGVEYAVGVSVMEIYNETVRDLLVDAAVDSTRKHEIRHGPTGTTVDDLSEVTVSSLDAVLQVMDTGRKNRSVASTLMNSDSSRSHLLVVVRITGERRLTGEKFVGKLTLVDLAGSERLKKSGATGERAVEARHINVSLAALGNVVSALSQRAKHVPYRDSKLTYLLQDSLGGNSKTLMFVQVAPTVSDVSETASSLAFAARVRQVELSVAKKARCVCGKNF
eukprot:TRINITY_DN945_c0_g1_i1.p1 TRINITY_DN945_c0_g1~~TRINITY_DN945_c0_g1_i1.p1  ORF type:complete len:828 (+),score=188.12 TRINITY_DN945_c0_g1_i1:92-2575(+)